MQLTRALLLATCLCGALSSIRSSPVGQKRLIQTSEDEPAKWMDQEEIWGLIENYVNFMDVTDHVFPNISSADHNIKAIPTQLRYESLVRTLFNFINMQRIQNFVRDFSAYHNRHHLAATGAASQAWLLNTARTSVQGYNGEVTVTEVPTPNSPQASIVVRIEGSDALLKDEVVIIGAHQDSINRNGATLQAPGADDNASGSVIVLETLRVLVGSGIVPKRTLEFQWYAAEEVGLWGSARIAQLYSNDNVNVVGMVNFDIAGYHSGTNEIAIHDDYTNPQLTTFLRLLADGYLEYGHVPKLCGYACSDHASFDRYGFPAARPGEVVNNPGMHTVTDTMANMSFNQVEQFLKLAIGYVIEMGEPAN